MSQEILILDITTEHIKKGEVSSTSKCPIALALWEKYNPESVHVTSDYIAIDGEVYGHCGGDEMCMFMSDFDEGDIEGWEDGLHLEFIRQPELDAAHASSIA